MDKTHPKFATIADLSIPLYSAVAQINGEPPQLVRLEDAVRSSVINNETLGYFIGRVYLFLVRIGIDPNRIRFRQHKNDEMAHYACDCWDAECHSSYGWIECVGCADRSCYDLTQHTNSSGQRLVAERPLPLPKRIQVLERNINRAVIGQMFRKDALIVIEHLEQLSADEARTLHEKLNQG
jgi:glycyl-tRNA synthetase